MADDHGPTIGVIVYQLARARDQNADDDFTARTILAALIGHGWRQVIEPVPPPKAAVPPTAEFLAARAAIQPPT